MVRRFVVLVLFLLVSLVALFSSPVLAEGDGFESDTFTVASYPDATPKWPCVARTPGGAFVVVWDAPDADDLGVFARRYAADGTPRGDVFQVNDLPAGNQGYPSVATWDDGSFVVLWRHGPDSDTEEVRASIFDADGNPEGPSVRLDEDSEEGLRGLGARSVAALPDGGFAATWVVGSPFGPIFGRLFDHDGTPRGEPFQVADSGRYPSVVTRGDDLLFSWYRDAKARGRLYDLAGNPRGDAFVAGNTEDARSIVPEGRIRPSGDFAFGFPQAWWDDEYLFAYHMVSHVSRDGTIETSFTIDDGSETYSEGNEAWRVAPLVDRWRRLTAVFTDMNQWYRWKPDRVRTRRYDGNFQSLAPYFDVARLGSGEKHLAYASADLDDDGNVVIAWSHVVSSTEGSIEARLLCSSLDTVGPADTDACEGQRVELHAETRGRSPFSWQWRKDGTDLEDGGDLSGSNTDTLVLDPVSSDDAGSYDCVVHDGCPDTQTYVTPAATLTVHGAIPEVPGLMLRKENMGADLHFTWQNVENAVDYVVRQDTEPDGPFDTVTGTADDGTEGLTVPMPEGEILFFEVHGRNPGCEGP